MHHNRDLVANVKEILDKNHKEFAYLHNPLQLDSGYGIKNDPTLLEDRYDRLNLVRLDQFFLAPRIPKYTIMELDKHQNKLYELFREYYDNIVPIEEIEDEMQLGKILIHRENHEHSSCHKVEIILYPHLSLAEMAINGKLQTTMPHSLIEKIKKENLESKVFRAFFQERKEAV